MRPCTKIHIAAATSILNVLDKYQDNDGIEKLGLNNDLIQRLSALNLTGQRYIVENATAFLSLEFDPEALEQQLEDYAKQESDKNLEDHFLQLNAPSKMMRELFGMHTTEFSLRRKCLGMSGHNQHRPFYCSEKTEESIWETWKQTEGEDDRERYLAVAKASEQPLNVVWTAVKKYNKNR